MKLTQNNLEAMYILQSLALRAHSRNYAEGREEAYQRWCDEFSSPGRIKASFVYDPTIWAGMEPGRVVHFYVTTPNSVPVFAVVDLHCSPEDFPQSPLFHPKWEVA